MLNILVAAELRANGGYLAICNYTAGMDHRTYDPAPAILHEEVEHEAWFSEDLGEGPSGHFRRSRIGSERNSPYLKKFLVLLAAIGALLRLQQPRCAPAPPP
jgi:hypothetical protein